MHQFIPKTIEELVFAYAHGQRHFKYWDFAEDVSAKGLDLSHAVFEHCFMFLDFRDSNLSHTQFISCNLKTADFRGANLHNALIKDCCVEASLYSKAVTTHLRFENNGYFGINLQQADFPKLLEIEVK